MLAAHHQTRMALGSDCTLVLVTTESGSAVDRRFADLWQSIFQFERQFSRFIPDSELSRLNERSGYIVPASAQFIQLLGTARALAVSSEGLFNPFILPSLHKAGYRQSFVERYRNDPQPDYANRQVAAPADLEIGDNWVRIPFLTALDLGGCGKGYLADQLAAHPAAQSVAGFWFSLGGDIAGAGYDQSNRPWMVQVASVEPSLPVTWYEAAADGFAIATSGPGVRRGRSNGRPWHHLIDPRSAQPSQTDVAQATVVADRAVLADVLASGAVLSGSQEAASYVRRQGARGAWLQWGEPARQAGFGRFTHESPMTGELARA